MTTIASLLMVFIAAGVFAGVLSLLGPDLVERDPVGRHRAAEVAVVVEVRREPGGVLPHRPAGKAALKAALADQSVPLPPAPPVHLPVPRKDHDDWRFRTAEYEELVEWHFAGEPYDQAVQRPYAGTGLVTA